MVTMHELSLFLLHSQRFSQLGSTVCRKSINLSPLIDCFFLLVKDTSAISANSSDTTLDSARTSLQMRKTLLAFQKAIGAPEHVPFPVIAAVHGHVISLGVDLIGVCNIRYAAANTSFAIKVCLDSFFSIFNL